MTAGTAPEALTPEAAASIRSASPADLCRSFAWLTHRLHAAKEAPITAARTRGEYVDTLRAHRDAVEAEMIRRMSVEVNIEERLDEPTRCTVKVDGVLRFAGVSYDGRIAR